MMMMLACLKCEGGVVFGVGVPRVKDEGGFDLFEERGSFLVEAAGELVAPERDLTAIF